MELPLPSSDTSQALLQDVYDRASAIGIPVDCIDDLPDTDGIFSKLVKHANSFVLEESCPDATFIDALQGLGSELGRRGRALSSHFTKLATLSRDFNQLRQRYNDSVNNIVQSQILGAVSGTSPTTLRDNLEKSVKHYEKERAKKSSKGFNERKQAALDTQQRVLQRAGCEYVTQMAAIREKREIEFSKQLVALYKAQQTFVDDSSRVMKELVPLAEHVLGIVSAEKSKIDTSKGALFDLKSKFEGAVYSCERQEKELDRLEKEGKSSTAKPVPGRPAPVPNPGLPRRTSEQDNTSLGSTATTESARQASDFAAFVEEIVSQAGNNVCADCARENPRWGACDIGVLLCEDCVRLHREPANALKSEQVARLAPDGNLSVVGITSFHDNHTAYNHLKIAVANVCRIL